MRILKLGVVGAIVVIVAIGALRLADVITAVQAPWLAKRALAAVALLVVAGLAIGAVAGRRPTAGAAQRPIP